MHKYFKEDFFYNLPSGNSYHPARCIIRDGTLTWSDALHSKEDNRVFLPIEQAHEQHIIKTAQRLEELNTWLMKSTSELHDCFKPHEWFNPLKQELHQGIALYFTHRLYSPYYVHMALEPHIKPHESLEIHGEQLFFKRC